MAKAEKWYDKSGSKWKTMPGMMLRYRAAAFWQRTYCPEISMGLITTEEAMDIDEQGYGVQTVEEEIRQNANSQTIKMDTTAAEPVKVASEIKQTEVKQVKQEAPVGQSSEIPDWMK